MNRNEIEIAEQQYLNETNIGFINIRQVTKVDTELMDRLDIADLSDYDSKHSLIFLTESDDFITYVDNIPKYISKYQMIIAAGFDLGEKYLEPKIKSEDSKTCYFYRYLFSDKIPTTDYNLRNLPKYFYCSDAQDIEKILQSEYDQYLFHYNLFHQSSILDTMRIDTEITNDPKITKKVLELLKIDFEVASELDKKEKKLNKKKAFLKMRGGSMENLKRLIEEKETEEQSSNNLNNDLE